MNAILEIPEIVALDGRADLIRIPQQIDVPITPRVRTIIDTPEFQRLTKISQLGLVAFVYPAANHNRFEHSLGVYRTALLFLRQLAHQSRFIETVSSRDATALILAALLHDIGHWPFCHPIEDLSLSGVPSHESHCQQYLSSPNVANCLRDEWHVEPQDVMALINKTSTTHAGKLLGSILSGPIDVDKMDYLYRDSLHAGVPYGQNFDAPRLIRNLRVSESGDRLAISHKGKTAAELMVFARYVMFSEVYWHHAVRSATAIFQRAFFLWYCDHVGKHDFDSKIQTLFRLPERALIECLHGAENNTESANLLNGLFGPQRRLFKRAASYNCFEGKEIYSQIAQKPYAWIVECSRHLTERINARMGSQLQAHQILIDAPPIGLEVQFDVQVYNETKDTYRDLGSVSPVVQTLARQQFDDIVKQVRVFVTPEWADSINRLPITELLRDSILDTAN